MQRKPPQIENELEIRMEPELVLEKQGEVHEAV